MTDKFKIDFEKVFEHVTTPLVVSEPNPPNVLLFVNNEFKKLTQYSDSELIGINPGKLLQRNSHIETRHLIRDRLNSFRPIDILLRNYKKDGTLYWAECHIHPVIEKLIPIYWVGMIFDVTESVVDILSRLDSISETVKENFKILREDCDKIINNT